MNKYLYTFLSVCLFSVSVFAQFPGGGGGGNTKGMNLTNMNFARLYGKVIDAKTKEPVEFAAVALLWFDKDSVIAGGLAKSNGDFALENLPFGGYRLRISFLGYKNYEQRIFVNMQNVDKDLGNIMLETDAAVLQEVTKVEEKSIMTMSIDRKVYNVDKDMSAKGGTGLDAVKNIPSVSVDADGNVSLRNNGVMIYVDGRPTTLTLQQIPSDQIDRIEIITNPSVKYDASATGGILNVIMKKNTKPGYNGMAMGGVGINDRYNGMFNLNVKENPFNFFIMYNYNTSTNFNDGFTNKTNLFNGNTTGTFNQTNLARSQNTFQFGRIGFDYNINNRNSITVSGNYVQGEFKTVDNQNSNNKDANGNTLLTGHRLNDSKNSFKNFTGQIQYRKTFPTAGKELTSDFNFNHSFGNSGYLNTSENYLFGSSTLNDSLSNYYLNTGNSNSNMFNYQLDFINPINDYTKFETGVKSNYSHSINDQNTFFKTFADLAYAQDSSLTNHYSIDNLVAAAYVNYSSKIWGIGYQGGLRFESSYYKGTLTNKGQSFSYQYPTGIDNLMNALFPAVYFSKKLPHNQELQLNFSRKINRPNFFQLMPFVMASDQYNIRIGNPKLTPEFYNLAELNYNITWGKLNYLTSVYGRYTESPITNVSYPKEPGSQILVNTFQNGNNSFTYGWEHTLKATVFKNLDITANFNGFYTNISWNSTPTVTTSNSGYSYTSKLMLLYKFPKNISLQLNGNYEAPKIIPQGTTRPQYYMDATLSYNWKYKWMFNLLLSDCFNSKRMGTNYVTPYYTQEMSRRRESRYIRLSVTYLFGKMDVSIFKKAKQQKGDSSQMDGMGGGF
ncbi:MAG TPA: outer membrane beta-barrel protein [Bacteroidia bacterium]|jgi:outer membrane receptor protein involved in Fe transport|nr:outer membrane beta-barrel protein [Bacteroidia bacterium]